MRILFLNELRGYFGGVEQCVADSSRGLASRGHECHLVYRSETGREPARFDGGFVSVQPCADLGEAGEGTVAALRAAIQRVRPDVIYVHKAGSIEAVLDAAGPVRVVRMIHDHDLVCPRRHKYDAYTGRTCQRPAGLRCVLDLAFLERAPQARLGVGLVNVADRLRELDRHRRGPRLLVASRYMRQELERNGCDPERIRVLPPCLEVHSTDGVPVPDEARLLYVGQLIRGKGVDLLLHALARLAPEYRLDVLGTGNADAELRLLAHRLGVAHRVTFHGWTPSSRTGAHFDASRIVVVPSRWPEPFGMVGVEAMAHGRAVVGFDVGGISDWLEHGVTGLLAPEQNVAEFARAIEVLHRTPGMAATLGEAGARRYQSLYRYPQLVSRLESELEDAAA